ncbi:MAG: PQQ-binding-like beta-propeller repeat protein [Thermoguttaceae bacterium]
MRLPLREEPRKAGQDWDKSPRSRDGRAYLRTGTVGALEIGSLVCFGVVLSLALLLFLFSPHVLDYDRSPIRSWLVSSILVSLCLVLSEFWARPGVIGRVAKSVLALLFAAAVVLFVPAKSHALRGEQQACMVWAAAALPAFIGACGIANFLIPRWIRQSRMKARGTEAFRASVFFVSVALVLLLAYAAAGAKLVGPWSPESTWVPKGHTSTGIALWVFAGLLHGLILIAWALSGYFAPVHKPAGLSEIPTTGRLLDGTLEGGNINRRAFHSGQVVRFGIVLSLVIVVLVSNAVVANELITRSEFLSYHFPTLTWRPEFGWWSVGCLGAVSFVSLVWALLSRRSSADAELARSVLFQVSLLALAAVGFASGNFLPTSPLFTRAVICLDAKDGSVLWMHECLLGPEGPLHRTNSPASPTPVVHQGRVYAYFGSAGVVCLDRDGRPVWANTKVRFQSMYGVGVSPVASGEVLVIVNGVPDEPHVVALSCDTGQLRWRRPMASSRRQVSGNSRTPLVKSINGQQAVLVWGFDDLVAYDLVTGKPLWSLPIASEGDMVASIVSDDACVYLAGPRETVAVRLPDADNVDPVALWKTRVRGSNCSSPVLSGGLLLMVSDDGIASCLNTKSGQTLWRHRLPGKYYSSPIAIGNLVYFCNSEGVTTVVAAGDQYQEVARNELGEDVYASFAPLADRIIARTTKHLVCLGGASDSTQSRPGP